MAFFWWAGSWYEQRSAQMILGLLADPRPAYDTFLLQLQIGLVDAGGKR